MRRLKLKITRGLKAFMIVGGLVGAMAFAAKHDHNALIKTAGTSIAFVGIAAGMKKKGTWDDLDDANKAFITQQDEVLKDLHEGKEALEKEVAELKAKGLTDEQITDLKEIAELKETVKKQATALDQIKNRATEGDKTGAIAKALKESDVKIKEFLAGSKNGKLEIHVKATQGASDIIDHTIADRVPGIGQLPVRKPFIEDLFAVINTNKEYVRYMDQNTVVRDAKNVAACAPTTHNTKLTWKEYKIEMTKVRDMIDICQDMMDDYDFVEGEIRKLIETSVALKVDSGLLLDDGEYPNLNSIDEASSEFDASNTLGGTITPWAGSVQEANWYDLAIAMISQIVALGQDGSYMPDTVLVNTVDKFKSMVIKDKNDNYLLPPFVAVVNNKEYTIDGMKVRSNPLVPANSMYVFDSTKATLYNRRGVTVELSYENATNFETETVTVKAYRRMNLLIRTVDRNAFMKASNVSAAIDAINKAV